jgi:hypothetical protein
LHCYRFPLETAVTFVLRPPCRIDANVDVQSSFSSYKVAKIDDLGERRIIAKSWKILGIS